MISELIYGTFMFLSIYELKINSVHLSGDKLLCPNSWVLVLIFDFEYQIWESSFRPFSF